MDLTIRPARLDDAHAVESFTEDTWPDHGGDYVPRVFESWVGSEGEDARTLVAADADGRAVGLVRTVLLSPSEAWSAGMRVAPDYRGDGVAVRLAEAGFDWARDRGASVARCMVFAWNVAGLGAARAAGFEPATEFRWAHPEPAAEFWRVGADVGDVPEGADRVDSPTNARVDDADAVWEYWQDSGAFTHLGGLALDPEEPWALSSLTRGRLEAAAEEGRLLAVCADGEAAGSPVHGVETGGVEGFAVRVRVTDREVDDGPGEAERWAEYGVADWATPEAAEAVFDAIARNAAAAGADRTRVLIPETVRAVSDAALARVEVAEAPDFVLAADLRR